MMFKEPPAGFKKRFDIVGCVIECNEKFLLLRRHFHKASGDKWGLPAGKRDEGENIEEALLREVEEETGISLHKDAINHFDSWYVRDKDFDIEWHMFSTELDRMPSININPHEHSEFKWVTKDEALTMDLIHDLPQSISLFYSNAD